MKLLTLADALEMWNEIEQASHVLMHCHPNADGDSLGSTLGLMHILLEAGKKVTIIQGDTPLPAYLSFLPGFNQILQKNFFQVSLTDYDLFLILDAAAITQISRLQPIIFPLPIKSIVIDHHTSNPGFGDIALIDPHYPATAHIVYELAKAWERSISHDAALCLFIGMYTDTGGFQWFTDRSYAAKTYKAAAELVAIAPDFADALFQLQNSNTAGRLKFEGLMLNSVQTWFNNNVAVASVSYADLEKDGISTPDTESGSISNTLKSVIGWNIGISVVEVEPHKVKISFRTRNSSLYDVSKIASVLGGGGHKGAAGVMLSGSLEESLEKIKEAIAKVHTF